MKRKLIAVILLMMLVVTACAPEVQSEDLMKDVSKVTLDGDEDVVVDSAAVSDFGVRLLQASDAGKENVLISPMSILCALGMTANGASVATERIL